jgi:type IV secretion system protein VirD4
VVGLPKELKAVRSVAKLGCWGCRLGVHRRAECIRKQVEAEYDAEAVVAAITFGRNPKPVLERAKRRQTGAAERDALVKNPPPLHGSVAWSNSAELTRFLRGRDAFDITLGTVKGEGASDPAVHWNGDGHLLTLAPTRSGKSVTTIIPNLLRYRYSAVVIDPKGELYEATSAWRAANVGPVYRIAPFDDGSDPATAAYARLMIRSTPEEWFSTHPSLEARIGTLEAKLFVQRLPYVLAKKPTQDRDEMVSRSCSLAY